MHGQSHYSDKLTKSKTPEGIKEVFDRLDARIENLENVQKEATENIQSDEKLQNEQFGLDCDISLAKEMITKDYSHDYKLTKKLLNTLKTKEEKKSYLTNFGFLKFGQNPEKTNQQIKNEKLIDNIFD